MKKIVNGTVVDMTTEEIAAWTVAAEEHNAVQAQQEAEAALEASIQAIIVTTVAGNTYQGDPSSQSAMARTITGAVSDVETIPWKMADNSWVSVNRVELLEALRLAGFEQSRLMML